MTLSLQAIGIAISVGVLIAAVLFAYAASFAFCVECRRAFAIFGPRMSAGMPAGAGRRCWKCWRLGRRWPKARLAR